MRRGRAASRGVNQGVGRKGENGKDERTDTITSHVGIAPVTEPF